MKRFRVVVNGTAYEVEVEEISQGLSSTAAPTIAPAPAPYKQEPTPAAAPQPVTEKPSPIPEPVAKPAPISAGGIKVEAPMPGTILDIRVNPGDSVASGDVLVILEAMKMENEIVAPQDGRVKEIVATKGASVDTGDILVILE